jgi:hypothetical protein
MHHALSLCLISRDREIRESGGVALLLSCQGEIGGAPFVVLSDAYLAKESDPCSSCGYSGARLQRIVTLGLNVFFNV